MIVQHLRGAKEDCTDVIGVFPLFPKTRVVFWFLTLIIMKKIHTKTTMPMKMICGKARWTHFAGSARSKELMP